MAGSRARGLVFQLADLVGDLPDRRLTDVDAVLASLTESAVECMDEAQSAGITVACKDGKVKTASASGKFPILLDQIQQRHGQGPCLSAATKQHVVDIPDLTMEERWPRFCRDALDETPVRSIMSFRLFADHRTMGALNFYAHHPEAFDQDAAELGLILATHIAVAWNTMRRDEQFRSALASRDIIGQAKGMVMERFKIDAVQAFELLKRLSQTSNTALVTVAKQLVEAEQRGR